MDRYIQKIFICQSWMGCCADWRRQAR